MRSYYTATAALVLPADVDALAKSRPDLVIESWGALQRLFYNGATACVGCGERDTQPLTISGTSVPLCSTCRARWVDLGVVTCYLSAALVERRQPVALPLPSSDWVEFLAPEEIRSRDLGVCRLCGAAESAEVPLEAGHILSRYDGGKQQWDIPRSYVNHPLNFALLCKPCNAAIGSASPSLRVGMHLLLKPWTGDPAGDAMLTARKRARMSPSLPFTTTEGLQ